MTQPDQTPEWAREHVKAVRDLLYHLMVYVLVNAMLVVIDLRSGGQGDIFGLDWAYWVIITWGFGVGGHAISVFFDEYRVRKLATRQDLRSVDPRSGEGPDQDASSTTG